MSDNKKFWILQYNNYYNRQIKRETSNAGYLEHYVYLQTANFTDYNDGINASILVGGPNQYEGNGDYVVVLNENNIIESRWFIVENTKTCGGQWQVLLRRDVIADFYDEVVSAPCYIEKATPSNPLDPAIFNKENLFFNQIKRWEQKIYDHTRVPWLVGYCAKGESFSASTAVDYDIPNIPVSTYMDIPNYNLDGTYYERLLYRVVINIAGTLKSIYFDFAVDANGNIEHLSTVEQGYSADRDQSIDLGQVGMTQSQFEQRFVEEVLSTQFNADSFRIIANGLTNTAVTEAQSQNQATYKTQDGDFYKFNLEISPNIDLGHPVEEEATWLIPNGSDIDVTMEGIFDTLGVKRATATDTDKSQKLFNLVSTKYTANLENLDIPAATVSFTKLETSSNNAPYAIFCMPYGRVQYGDYDKNDNVFYNNKDLCMNLMIDLIKQNTGANPKMFDAQILPYCPIEAIESQMRQNGGFLRVQDLNDPSVWTPILQDETTLGYLFHCPSSTVRYNLSFRIDIPDNELKISNECDTYRLVSPNWNGQFEFSAAMNYGVDSFNVDMELRPYNPYIHVAPAFKGLYGKRDNDAIGLICGGDFSLTQVSDAYATYARQNKNFQEIFDRQIQNLTTQQDIQRKYEQANIITGTITGAASGASSGAIIGSTFGPMGTAIGGIAGGLTGGVASAVGGNLDYKFNEALRNEALDYTKDMYNMNLQNIKALPDSLTKVSSFNPNNELYVFLEYYTCTDEEKEALRNKLKYNGYSIGRISTIKNFQHNEPTYIKGKIIRLENLGEDTHSANVIAEEINKGVFI